MRRRRIAASALLALGLLLALASPASAHASLESSDPAPDAVLDEAPAQVVLRFSEAVRMGDDAIRVFDANGRRVDEGDLSRPDGDSTVASAKALGIVVGAVGILVALGALVSRRRPTTT